MRRRPNGNVAVLLTIALGCTPKVVVPPQLDPETAIDLVSVDGRTCVFHRDRSVWCLPDGADDGEHATERLDPATTARVRNANAARLSLPPHPVTVGNPSVQCSAGTDGVLNCHGGGNVGDGLFPSSEADRGVRLDWLPPIRAAMATDETITLLDEHGGIHTWVTHDRETNGRRMVGRYEPLRGVRQLRLHDGYGCAVMNDATVRCWGAVFGIIHDAQYAWRAATVEGVTHVRALVTTDTGLYWQDDRNRIHGRPGRDDDDSVADDPGGWRVLREDPIEHLVDVEGPYYWGLTAAGLVRYGDHAGRLMMPGTGTLNALSGFERRCIWSESQPVRCFGNNDEEQIANTLRARIEPPGVVLHGATAVRSFAMGHTSYCAIGSDARVSCWGSNAGGQLGVGDRRDRTTPTLVAGLGPARSLSMHGPGACAVTLDGAVWCWGIAAFPRGREEVVDQIVPRRVEGIDHAEEVAIGGFHACARTEEGRVACWRSSDREAADEPLTAESVTPTWVVGDPAR